MAMPAGGSGSTPAAPARAQEEVPARAQEEEPVREPPAREPPVPGRNPTVARVGEAIEATGVFFSTMYPSLAHTRDFFLQIGQFVPNEKIKGCPGMLMKAAASCKRLGTELEHVTMCLQGVSGVCALVGSVIRRLNMRPLEEEPQVTHFISTIDELHGVVITWLENPRPINIDLDPAAPLSLARRVELFLYDQGERVMALFENSPTYKSRLAQYRRSQVFQRKGVKEVLVLLERYTAGPVSCVPPTSDQTAVKEASTAASTVHKSGTNTGDQTAKEKTVTAVSMVDKSAMEKGAATTDQAAVDKPAATGDLTAVEKIVTSGSAVDNSAMQKGSATGDQAAVEKAASTGDKTASATGGDKTASATGGDKTASATGGDKTAAATGGDSQSA